MTRSFHSEKITSGTQGKESDNHKVVLLNTMHKFRKLMVIILGYALVCLMKSAFVECGSPTCSKDSKRCKHGSIMSADEKKAKTPSYEALEEALGFMKKAYDIMHQQAEDVRKEKEAFESVAKKLDHVHFSSTIKLNVGGQHFTTSLQTLTKDTGSMLHAMFSERFDTKPAKDGSYFIDRDGTHFRYILNYLRTGRLILPEDKLVRKELLEEAEFYQIRGIVDGLLPQSFLESKILSDEQKAILVNTWLEEPLRKPRSSFVLIYRASRDGWASSRFHALCDNKEPTVTVVKSGDNIFGGYTEQSWDSKFLACTYTVLHLQTDYKAPSTRIQIFLNPQLFLSGFKNISIHT